MKLLDAGGSPVVIEYDQKSYQLSVLTLGDRDQLKQAFRKQRFALASAIEDPKERSAFRDEVARQYIDEIELLYWALQEDGGFALTISLASKEVPLKLEEVKSWRPSKSLVDAVCYTYGIDPKKLFDAPKDTNNAQGQ